MELEKAPAVIVTDLGDAAIRLGDRLREPRHRGDARSMIGRGQRAFGAERNSRAGAQGGWIGLADGGALRLAEAEHERRREDDHLGGEAVIAGRAFEIAAVGAELAARFRLQLLDGKGKPRIALGAAWQSGGDEAEAANV